MSAQVVHALLARAEQLDEQASVAAAGAVSDPQAPQASPRLLRWLAGEFRALARIAQGYPPDEGG